jgi:serine/threonine protein kinase
MTERRRIGKYKILEEIGRGGFAVVYKARDTELDRIVALKVLHPYWTADPDFVTRFRREARAAARLRHPHIVTVYEASEAEGQLYIAMEYLPGRTLGELLEAERVLPLERALRILEQIADALDHAHAQGVVHRDVKPANVAVEETEQGLQVTLMDFGLVKAMAGSSALTSQGTLLGSPEYMAPEQADPERAAEIGPAADRYALGIVAYQMLTGRVPFPGNIPATLNAHEHKPVPRPRSLRPSLSEAVEAALLKMLAKAPADRFPSACTFVARFQEAQLHPTVSTRVEVAMSQELIGDRYQIKERIGHGGFSEVFLAVDRRLDRQVAIKRLHLLSVDATDRERFLREARILANLQHRHIITIYALEKKNGYLYIVMEYADQGSLDNQIKASPGGLPIDDVVDVGIAMCKALSVVHEKEIVHRDVKPHNILLVTEQGEGKPVPKLADFGLARIARTRITPTGKVLVGTVPYMPPEAFKGAQKADKRWDVYGLGVTLYEALTGCLPRGRTIEEIAQILNRPPTSPRHRRSDVPEWLEKVVLKALAADRDHRYPTMRQMLADLESGGQEQPAGRWLTDSRVRRILDQAAANLLGNMIWVIMGAILAVVLALVSPSYVNKWGVTLLGTDTATPTATATASLTVSPTPTAATITPTPTTPTVSPSPTPTPTAATPPTPTLTSSPTPTPTPSPTPTSTPTPPPTATSTPLRATAPEPVAPAQGRKHLNPITFEWRGSLSAGQAYSVTAWHVESGYVIPSELLASQSWTTDLPAERYGEWRWTVSVVQGGRTMATSSEWMFWFDPYPGSEKPPPTNLPPPTPKTEHVHRE